MKVKIIVTLIICLLAFNFININDTKCVNADQLNDNINEQLQNIDFSQLEEYINNLSSAPVNFDFFSYINKILNGEFDLNFNSIIEYTTQILFSNLKNLCLIFTSVIAISILCGIIQKTKSSYLSTSIGELILFVGLLSVILLISSPIISAWKNTIIVIENIAKLSEIMSPIIVTLMIASGASISANIYKPAVAFLSNGVINIILTYVMPLIAIMMIFNILSNFTSLKLTNFSDMACSIIKWIIGLTITIFGIFISIQGLSSATFDGISIKATKFAISNSIPIIGGFLKDGFDLVVAGSILIKNAVGIVSVFILFYTILSPVLYIATLSLLLKFVSAIIEPITDSRISAFCSGMSKCITYLSVALLTVGFMLFITILLMTFSANAFI